MKNLFSCVILLFAYILVLMEIGRNHNRKPGILEYTRLATGGIVILTGLHIQLIIIMLLPSWFVKSPPLWLIAAPGKLDMAQIGALLCCLIGIVSIPWKRWLKELPDDASHPISGYQLTVYGLTRVLYLIVYEWFFRGLLLIPLYQVVGATAAIATNTVLYCKAHLHKEKAEIAGCVPMGIVLCVFTIWWQSIWPAVVLHLTMAGINEWPAFRHCYSQQKKLTL